MITGVHLVSVNRRCWSSLPVTTQWTGAHNWSQLQLSGPGHTTGHSYNSVGRGTRLVTVTTQWTGAHDWSQLQLSGQGHTTGHSYNSVDRGTRLVTVTTQWTGAKKNNKKNAKIVKAGMCGRRLVSTTSFVSTLTQQPGICIWKYWNRYYVFRRTCVFGLCSHIKLRRILCLVIPNGQGMSRVSSFA